MAEKDEHPFNILADNFQFIKERLMSMLALLEKALPIIVKEAENRDMAMQGDSDRIYNAGEYWTEMRDLADEISDEIDKARGLRIEHPDAEQCSHGFGFVEYCEDCKGKEVEHGG